MRWYNCQWDNSPPETKLTTTHHHTAYNNEQNPYRKGSFPYCQIRDVCILKPNNLQHLFIWDKNIVAYIYFIWLDWAIHYNCLGFSLKKSLIYFFIFLGDLERNAQDAKRAYHQQKWCAERRITFTIWNVLLV